MSQVCSNCSPLNPYNVSLDARSVSVGTIVTALVAIGCTTGILMLLASQGVNIGVFNALNASSIWGGIITGTGFLLLAAAGAWWIKLIKNHSPLNSCSSEVHEDADQKIYGFWKTQAEILIPLVAGPNVTLEEAIKHLVHDAQDQGEDTENENDVLLFFAGIMLNRGSNLTRTMRELDEIYNFSQSICMLINQKISPEQAQLLGVRVKAMKLPEKFKFIQQVDDKEAFTCFQTAIHDFCEPILRKTKFGLADRETLSTLNMRIYDTYLNMGVNFPLRDHFVSLMGTTLKSLQEVSSSPLYELFNELNKLLSLDCPVTVRSYLVNDMITVQIDEGPHFVIPKNNIKYSEVLTSLLNFSQETSDNRALIHLNGGSPSLYLMLNYLSGNLSEEALIQAFSQMNSEDLSRFLGEATYYGMHRIELLVQKYLIENIDDLSIEIEEESAPLYRYLARAQEIRKTGEETI